MASRKITLDSVKVMKPGEVIWDTDTPGLCVRCQRKAKVYGLKYRIGTRQRWHSIGRHGAPWTPDLARKEARRLLGHLASGIDPAERKSKERGAPTLSELAERFMTEHVLPKRKSSTAAAYRHLLDHVILPESGDTKVRDITTADVLRLHHKHRSTPYQANRAIAVLSKMMALAETWGERPRGSNPAGDVEKYRERKRERLLSADELARLGAALKDAEQRRIEADRIEGQLQRARVTLADRLGDREVESAAREQIRSLHHQLEQMGELASLEAIAAIRLLLFSGARLNEILSLEWTWIDFERGEARLPDSKTGAKTLQLPVPALEVLDALPRFQGNPHVIAGRKAGAHMVNLQKPWRRIRKAAGLDGLRIHDLRHGFASVAASAGVSLHILGKVLGHSQASTTHRYAHLSADPVKQAANAVANTIAAAMQGETAEIVPISGRGGRA